MKHNLLITKERPYTRTSDYEAFSLVRVQNSHIGPYFGSGEWVKIKNIENGSVVYRIVKGVGNLDNSYFPKDAIEIDYKTAIQDLGIAKTYEQNSFYCCNLCITKASKMGQLIGHCKHPDPAYRVPLLISFLSLILGAIGLALGLLGIFL